MDRIERREEWFGNKARDWPMLDFDHVNFKIDDIGGLIIGLWDDGQYYEGTMSLRDYTRLASDRARSLRDWLVANVRDE